MNYHLVLSMLGRLLLVIALAMVWPLLWGYYYKEPEVTAFWYSIGITLLTALVLIFFFRPKGQVRNKEGFFVVALSWITASLFGSLPYVFSGTFEQYADAFFETMSGFSTTGATVISNIEALPQSILFWRSLTHWLGGMGIMVLFIALLSQFGVGAFQMFKAESPGPVKEKILPKISQSAKTLWLIYVILTGVLVLLLWLSGMTLFDSLTHSFGTLATGGFSTKNASIGYYDSVLIEWIIILFMFLAGANFALYYQVFRGKSLKSLKESREFKLYAFLVISSIAIISVQLFLKAGHSWLDAIRYGSFQAISVITTTGFATSDYEMWPFMAQGAILLLMFIGGCAGSTSGGVKVGRHLILIKQAAGEFKKMVHSKAVFATKLGDKPVSDSTVISVAQFLYIYLVIIVLVALILTGYGYDLATSFSAAITTIGNVGPGFGQIGPTENFGGFEASVKYILSFTMLLGRLELYTVLVLFTPSFWKK